MPKAVALTNTEDKLGGYLIFCPWLQVRSSLPYRTLGRERARKAWADVGVQRRLA